MDPSESAFPAGFPGIRRGIPGRPLGSVPILRIPRIRASKAIHSVMREPMKSLSLGGRVRVHATNASFNCRIGRIVHITQPFVANERMKVDALAKMPLYDVQLEDGSHQRCRGLDLEHCSGGEA